MLFFFSESLAKFPRRTNPSPAFQGQPQQSEGQLQQQQQQQQQQSLGQNSNNDNSVQAAAVQLASSTGTASANNTTNPVPTTSSSSTIAGLLHQNSMNSRQQNPMSSTNGSYGGNNIVQMPSPGSSSAMPQTQPPPSPFQSPTPSSSNNPQPTSHGSLSGAHVNSANSPNISMQQPALSGDADANDSQSSVQKIIHDMMMSSHLGGGGGGMMGMGSMGGDVKNMNGMLSASNNGGNILVGTGVANGNNTGIGVSGFGSVGNGLGQSAMVNGIRAALGNNSMSMNGRIGMHMTREQGMNSQQQEMGSQLLNGFGSINGFNNLQFDWKASP